MCGMSGNGNQMTSLPLPDKQNVLQCVYHVRALKGSGQCHTKSLLPDVDNADDETQFRGTAKSHLVLQ